MRIGIDVGGTHTDAVLLDGGDVVMATKRLTTADVTSGIRDALDTLLSSGVPAGRVQAVMIGTTQFTNAVVERRSLTRVDAIRIAAPSGRGLPPKVDWPEDLREAIGPHSHVIKGGYLYDGWPLAALDDEEIDALIETLRGSRSRSVVISSAFAPINPEPERVLARRLADALPGLHISLSHKFSRLGLQERENAALLNAALLELADRVVTAFETATRDFGLHCPVFVSQNDGTLMNAGFVREYPALTFASGPTNSLRGAAKLSGLHDAIVVDIGGTTSDIGVLQNGFPRESNRVIEVGGVRTNFRMPDILALGLGGGSIVADDGRSIGPRSVGHDLLSEGLHFGGSTLTATDIALAAGGRRLDSCTATPDLPAGLVRDANQLMHDMLDAGIDRMKPSKSPLPVILVGGGAILIPGRLAATDTVIRPENAGVANAIGAAIAQIGGEAEAIHNYADTPRETALEQVAARARQRAMEAGADPDTLRIVDQEEIAVPYMERGATRVRVKLVGEIAAITPTEVVA